MFIPTESSSRESQVARRIGELRRILRRAGGRCARDMQMVVPYFFKNASDAFVLSYRPEDLSSILSCAYRVMSLSRGVKVSISVFNPEESKHGFSSARTVVQISAKDGPFYVASVRECLRAHGLTVVHLIHPILPIAWDGRGRMKPIFSVGAEPGQSFIHVEVGRVEDAGRLGVIETALHSVFSDIRRVVADFSRLRAAVSSIRAELDAGVMGKTEELKEGSEFLKWLLDGNFVFLGYREYDLVPRKGQRRFTLKRGSGLGILRAERRSRFYRPVPLSRVVSSLRRGLLGASPFVVAQTTAASPIYRREPMTYIGFKKFDDHGRVAGERRILGLFTNRVEGLPSTDIPILRKKFAQVVEAEGVREHSHDYREIYGIFSSYPKDLLFGASLFDLRREIRTALVAQSTSDFKATFRPDLRGRGISVMVVMSKDKFNREARLRIEDVLKRRLEATGMDYSLSMGTEAGEFARLYFFCVTPRKTPLGMTFSDLERELAEVTKTWPERLYEELVDAKGPKTGEKLFKKYGSAFSVEFHSHTPPKGAVHDILKLEPLSAPTDIRIQIFNSKSDLDCTRLKLYHLQTKLALSDIMPVLSNHGFRVLDEVSNSVRPASPSQHPLAFIHTFRIQQNDGPLPLGTLADALIESILDSLLGQVECDSLCGLTLKAGLTSRQVSMLRLYRNYLHQIVPVHTLRSIDDALTQNFRVARILRNLFVARFDPALGDVGSPRRRKMESGVREDLEDALNEVDDIVEDRVLRLMAEAVSATVRTNYFQTPPRRMIGIKIRSADIDAMPRPVPLFEIFVGDSRVEGIHLRGGQIARGGIRHSDRRDDYRTEILGLMKTQMVKNAIIVPVGAKGGFVVKRASSAEEVVSCYRAFIRTLLDLTDNIIDGRPVFPVGCVIHDEPDPYLVVAADKGTAHFSDIANDISLSAGFWLGDAFASGGKDGYDHKKLGITARGVWVCLEHHLKSAGNGKHPASGEMTCIGIGDMSGDVFGNGMLVAERARSLKLQAAFNHQYIFLDPNPDPRKSYRERARLFRLPRSTWANYHSKCISRGGGVFPRSAKKINLSPQARRMLEMSSNAASGEDVIRAILKMKVDILYNGGIGTYVKSSEERHADVGDPTNDRLRVSASEIRARIVGEGGNLGFTQAARIEFAKSGGRIDTDAVDNSAGVDLSDHEVNLKILLRELSVPEKRRRRILRRLTAAVCRSVLLDNYFQSMVLSLEGRRSAREMDVYPKLMETLQDMTGFSRQIEHLPSDREMLERSKRAQSFWRPELAALLAHVKLAVNKEILETSSPQTPLCADPILAPFLSLYFPDEIVRSFGSRLNRHPLADQITAAVAANAFVNRAGLTTAFRLSEECDVTWAQAVRSYFVADRLAAAESIRVQISRLRNFESMIDALDALEESLSDISRWLVKEYAGEDVSPALKRFSGVTGMFRLAESLLSAAEKKNFRDNLERLISQKIPPALAVRISEVQTTVRLLELQVASDRLRNLR